MARAALVAALALGWALTPPRPQNARDRPPGRGQRKEAVVTAHGRAARRGYGPDGPLLADAPPLLDGAPPLLDGANNRGPPTLTTTTIPPIPDELEDAVRKRSAEEQAEKAKEQIKIARSKKKGDWYKFGFQTKESQAQPKVTIDITVPEGARAGDRLQVTVLQDVDVLEYLGVTEPKPPCVTSESPRTRSRKNLPGLHRHYWSGSRLHYCRWSTRPR